jgi:hypothetical protein
VREFERKFESEIAVIRDRRNKRRLITALIYCGISSHFYSGISFLNKPLTPEEGRLE